MKFKTIAESFNFYRNASIQQIETRAAEIKGSIETDAEADITSLNIEIQGLNAAKENIADKNQTPPVDPNADQAQRSQFNPITGGSFETRASNEALTGDVFASPEYRTAFFKTLLGQKLTPFETTAYDKAQGIVESEKRTSAFDTATSAAAVLPTATLNEIVTKARTMGGLISEARNFNIPTKLSVPIGTPGSRAQHHVEGAPVDSEATSTTKVSFDGYELIKILSISAKAKKMSIAAFESYIIEELNAAIMETINYDLINGTGTDQGSGLDTITWLEGVNLITVALSSTLAYTDITKAVSLLKRGYSSGAKWAMNNATLYNSVYGMVDSNKRPLFIQDPKGESIGKILGFDVVIDDNIETDGDIFFGNYNYLGYNLPEGIVVDVSRDSSFKSGLIDYRAMAIYDNKPIITEAFIKLQKATV